MGSGESCWQCEPGEAELPQPVVSRAVPVVELSADLAELLPHPTFPLPLQRSEEGLPALQRKIRIYLLASPRPHCFKILLRFVLPLCWAEGAALPFLLLFLELWGQGWAHLMLWLWHSLCNTLQAAFQGTSGIYEPLMFKTPKPSSRSHPSIPNSPGILHS